MSELDREEITKAAKLLAKAASTDSDAEALALAERAYRAIAAALSADPAFMGADGSPRRERRFLPDRRASRQAAVPKVVTNRAASAGALYREALNLTRGSPDSQVDLEL